ncbi:hypothetical protein GGF31_004686 [Allomyces arbusculus]|nr:hypothetical protein GGF31_004686 [Allomyces arbusculus]
MIGSAGANVKPEPAAQHAVMFKSDPCGAAAAKQEPMEQNPNIKQDIKPDVKLDVKPDLKPNIKNEAGAPEGGYPHLQSLNDAQFGAVTCDNPALIILAGPGSGKTRVITSRVADLVLRRDVRPENIVVVTFTNKAANEMRERIQKAIGPYMTGRLQMGTFHALCAKLLRKHGYRIELKSNFTIADRSDSEAYMKRIVKAVDPKCTKPANYLWDISKFKARNQGPADVLSAVSPGAAPWEVRKAQLLADVFTRYQDELKAHNILDFDDLLVYGHQLFTAMPELSDGMHEVLVDEFQDTNAIQYDLTTMMCAKHQHLTIVGDPDQSIYAWRAADVTNLHKVQKLFPAASMIHLEENYRSTQAILQAAHRVISQDKKRIAKSLYTNNPMGHAVFAKGHLTSQREAEFVCNQIRGLVATGQGQIINGDFAVLVRSGYLTRSLEEAFVRAKIPHRIIGGMRFYERTEIKDVLAYLRLADNPHDRPSFERVINVPARGIGDTSVGHIIEAANALQISCYDVAKKLANKETVPGIKRISRVKLAEFVAVIEKLREMAAQPDTNVADIIAYLVSATKYEDYLKAKDAKEATTRWENVQELLNTAAQHSASLDDDEEEKNEDEDAMDEDNDDDDDRRDRPTVDASVPLRSFLNSVSLVSDIDQETDQSKVTISTLHAAKGLEWPVVFVVGADASQLPHALSTGPAQIEEERRLLYVGMTRAERLLYVTWPERRTRYGGDEATIRSPFLACLDGAMFPKTKKLLLTTASPTVDQPLLDFFTKVRQHQAEHTTAGAPAPPAPVTSTTSAKRPLELDTDLPDLIPVLKKPRAPLALQSAPAGGFTTASQLPRRTSPPKGGGFTSAAALPRTAPAQAPATSRGKTKAAAAAWAVNAADQVLATKPKRGSAGRKYASKK